MVRIRLLVVVGSLVAGMLATVVPGVAAEPCTIEGTEADDILEGTTGDDVICGYGGDDTIAGHEGDDIIYGGAGDDTIGGGQGDDVIYGEDGADTVEGKAGADTIYGGLGDDDLAGNEDNDTVYGDEGDDFLGGGKGDDVIYGGDGADTVEGKTGADTIYGGLGDDDLAGNEDNDTVYGEAGNDTLGGGKADDLLDGGDGDDTLDGKRGDDELIGGPGVDSANGNIGTDVCAAETMINCESSIVAPSELLVDRPTIDAMVFDVELVTVSVLPVGAVGSVEFAVDGTSLGQAAILDGSAAVDWDTTAFSDGPVTLTATALDSEGGTVASNSVAVTIGNVESPEARLSADYDQGFLTLDQYSFSLATALTVPDVLPARYLGGSDGAEESGFEWLVLAEEWELLSPTTQQQITDLLAAYDALDEGAAGQIALDYQVGAGDVPQAGLALEALAAPQGPLDPPATFPIDDWDGCEFDLDLSVGWVVRCEQSAGAFKIKYELVGDHDFVPRNAQGVVEEDVLGRSGTDVAANHCTNIGSCNGVPDYIDHALSSMILAHDSYTTAGYQAPDGVLLVGVHKRRAEALPPGLPRDNDINLRNWGNEFETARHEVFHTFQYQYASVDDLRDRNAWWWAEATAEWATHTFRPSGRTGETKYHRQLPAFLGRPNLSLTLHEETNWFVQRLGPKPAPTLDGSVRQSQYGAFVMADWLEALEGDEDIILRTWQELGEPDNRNMLEAIADAMGQPLGDVVYDFHVGSYLLQKDGHVIDDEVASWRNRLNGTVGSPPEKPLPLTGENTTVADAFGAPRPARITQLVVENASTAAPTSGLRDLEPGGVAYVEMLLPAGEGELTVTVPSTPQLRYGIVAFGPSGYPDLCTPAEQLSFGDIGGGFQSAQYVYDSSCESATMIVSWPNALESGSVTAIWNISHSTSTTRLVVSAGSGLWEWVGATWVPLAPLPGADPIVWDIETLDGEIFAWIDDFASQSEQVFRLDATGWISVSSFAASTSAYADHLVATSTNLYRLGSTSGPISTAQLWRYNADDDWTLVASVPGRFNNFAATSVGGVDRVVLLANIGPFDPGPTQATVWSWTEADGLQQGTFVTDQGSTTVYSEGNLQFGEAVDFGGEVILGTSADILIQPGAMASSDGLTWTFVSLPALQRSSAAALHNGEIYRSGYSYSECCLWEGGVIVYDGTTETVLPDPNPAMAWASFVSDGSSLWMAGFRDADDYSQDIVEWGIYRSTNGIDRVATSTNDPSLKIGSYSQLLLVDP